MRTFLSIGSGPGIGVATAERFAREGFRLVLTARGATKLEERTAALRAAGHEAEARVVDAGNLTNLATLVADVESKYGGIDALHYNAASLRAAKLEDQDAATILPDLATNIGGALAAIKAASPQMVERGSGSILLTGGGFGLAPHPNYLSLSIGKAGIRSIALGLFETLKERGVHVATVTVAALVRPGSREASEIANVFWDLHAQAPDAWSPEVRYPG